MILKNNKIPLFWAVGSNLGDALSPIITEFISGKKTFWCDQSPEQITYVVVGSLLDRYTPYSHIWGSGFASSDHQPSVCYSICSVRGKLTRQKYLDAGIECPPVYGDPALLLKKYYDPKIEKKYKLGIIPHAIERDICAKLYEGHEERLEDEGILIIDIMRGDALKIVDCILSCEKILSSALHGIIVAQVYGIATHHIKFSDLVIGGNFKYFDYYSSVQIPEYDPIYITPDIATNFEFLKCLPVLHDIKFDSDKLLEACPFKK